MSDEWFVASGEWDREPVQVEAKRDRMTPGSGGGLGHSPLATDHSPLLIHGYASLWGVADLNGDVVARGAFADSLRRTGAGGVRMLHQHESRAVVGVWDEVVEDQRGRAGRTVDRLPRGQGQAGRAASGAVGRRAVGGVAGDVSDAAGGAVQSSGR